MKDWCLGAKIHRCVGLGFLDAVPFGVLSVAGELFPIVRDCVFDIGLPVLIVSLAFWLFCGRQCNTGEFSAGRRI